MKTVSGDSQSGRIVEMFEVPYEGAVNVVYGMARDSEGWTYVAFSGAIEGHKPPLYSAIVTRLDTHNNPDKNYGELGFATVDFFRESGLFTPAMVLQDDGSVVLIGYGVTGGGATAGLVKLDASGQLDQAFGNGGSIIHYLRDSVVATAPVTDATTMLDEPQDSKLGSNGRLTFQSSDTLICCGNFTREFKYLVILAKFRPDGSLDRTFGQDGIIEISPPRTEVVGLFRRAVAELSDGRIVVCGSAQLSSGDPSQRGWICRCLPDGVLDQTFGDEGHLILEIPEGTSDVLRIECNAVAQGPEFSLACVSDIIAMSPDLKLNVHSQVSLLDQNGVDRHSFNAGKPVIFDVVSHEVDSLYAVAVDMEKSNKLVAVGTCISSATSGRPEMLVARFNADGSRDLSFAGQGWLAEAYKGGFHRLWFILLGKKTIVALGENQHAAIVTVISR